MPQTNVYEPSTMALQVHSITFAAGLNSDGSLINPKNTWDHFHLVSSERPTVVPPSPKSNYVEIPGGSGSLDLSEALTGYPTYANREGEFEFAVLNDYETENGIKRQKKWSDLFNEIAMYLHGQKMIFVLSDDPEYYYEGRLALNEYRSTVPWSTVVISYNVKPFKISRKYITDNSDWLWDPFNFNTDIAASRALKFVLTRQSKEVTITKSNGVLSPGSVTPVIYTSKDTLEFDYSLKVTIIEDENVVISDNPLENGDNLFPEIAIKRQSEYKFIFTKDNSEVTPTIIIKLRKETF